MDDYALLADEERQQRDNARTATPDDVYAGMAADEVANRDNALKASLRQAVPVAPDAAAKSKALSAATGVPVEVVDRNTQAVAAQARVQELQKLAQQSPVLARQLADPEFAKLSHDDAENLSLFERTFKTYLGASVKSGVESLVGTGVKLVDALNPFTLSEADAAVLFKDKPEELAAFMRDHPSVLLTRFTRAMQQASEATMQGINPEAKVAYGDLKYGTLDPSKAAYLSPLRVVGDAIQSLPTTLALAVTMYLTKGTAARVEAQALEAGMAPDLARRAAVHAAAETAAKLGASTEGAAGFAQQSMQTREQADRIPDATLATSPEYQRLIAQGYTPEAARVVLSSIAAETAGAAGGAADAIVNFFGGGFLGKIITEGGALLKRAAKGFATEALTESAQGGLEQLGQNQAVKAFLDPNQELLDGVAEQMAQGFVVGGVMGGAFGAVAGRKRQVEQAAGNAAALQKLFEVAVADKLRERSPADFAKFVQGVAEESGTPAVFIDAATFAQAAQEKGLDVAATMPETAAQLAEAITTKGDVRIPLGELTAALPGTGLENTLMQHMRTSIDGPTLAETQDKKFAEETQAEVMKAMVENDFTTAHKESAAAVENELLTQLTAANRFTKDVNSAYAKLMASFYAVQAARLNITPEEMYVKYPLRIQAEGVTNASALDQAQNPATVDEAIALVGEARFQQLGEQALLDARAKAAQTNAPFGEAETAAEIEKLAQRLVAAKSTLAQEEPAQPFYSMLTRQVEAANVKAAPAQGWKDLLKGLTSKGVKKEEIEWSGINDWLDTQEGKITKDQVLAYLANNGVRVEETVLGGASSFEAHFGEWEDDVPEKSYFEETARDLYLDDIKQDIAARDDIPVEEVDAEEAMAAAIQRAEHSFYDDPERPARREIDVTANGKDYKFIASSSGGEFDLFAPSNQSNELDAAGGESIEVRPQRNGRQPDDAQIEAAIRSYLGEKLGIDFDSEGAPFADYTLPGGENYQVLLLTLPETFKDSNAPFRSSHFNEPNILAHVRTTERTDTEGKRVLFVEEIQSDWAQKGKKEGFKTPVIHLGDVTYFTVQQTEHQYVVTDPESGMSVDVGKGTVGGEQEAKEYAENYFNGKLREQRIAQMEAVPPAPFIAKTEAWVTLVLKRVIVYAVDNGFERVAWTTGEQQADRYSLSKQVSQIGWEPATQEGDRTVRIKLLRHDTLGFVVDAQGVIVKDMNMRSMQVEGKKLEDVIGKTAAEKIMGTPKGSLEGEGLKIGGEGMLAFYDKIVPNIANDVLKKVGGSRVGTVNINVGLPVANREMAKLRDQRKEMPGQPGFDITPEMAVKVKGGLPLFQGNRGLYNVDSRTISLLKNADLSTFLHESGHFYLEVLADVASQPSAPPEIVADIQRLLDWFGVKDLETWNKMSLAQKRPHHEKLARGFEAYLFEGKAPSQELAGLFARFRAWMLNVYRQLVALNVELSDEVRGVFNRMLATMDEIVAAEAARGYAPLFKSAAEMGATPEEWKAYQEQSLDATHEAVAQLEARSLRDMQWLSNAKGRALRKLQKAAASKRKAVEAEVTTEVRAQPVYAALRFLSHGELPEAHRSNAERKLLESIAGLKAKLSIPDLKAIYGDGPAAPWRYLNTGKFGTVAAEDGVNPEMVAELFGFTSGDELVRKILEAEPEATVIEGMTDQRMLERYGDLSSPEAIEQAANEAIHNEARAKFMATELRALAKATGQKNILVKAAKEFAATIIGRKKLREISPAKYAAAEARAGRAAERAKSLVEKATEKRNQIVNHYATRAAYDAIEEIQKGIAYLRRVGDSKTVDPEYREQIVALLERFDLRAITNKEADKRASLEAWIKAQEKDGLAPLISDELRDTAFKQPYRELSLEEFRGLVDAVKNIEHIGRLKHRLLTAKDQREFEAVRDDIKAAIVANAKKSLPEQRASDRGFLVSTGRLFRTAAAIHRKFASLVRGFDGFKDGGVAWEYLVRTMNERGTFEAVASEKATRTLGPMIDRVMKAGKLTQKKFFPETGKSFTREERISFLLNMGNDVNLERLTTGERLSPAQLQSVVGTLTKADAEFANQVWEYLESFWPEIAAKEERVTGVVPERVQPRPFTLLLHSGETIEMRGGYYPIAYDPLRSERSSADLNAEVQRQIQQGLYTRAQTARGHTKERTESTGRALRYDFGQVLSRHITQVIHDLAWHEYLLDANRLLRTGAIEHAVKEHYGVEVLTELKDTLTDIAIGNMGTEKGAAFFNHLRYGTTIATLAFNVFNTLQNLTGLTQSMSRIGTKWVLKGAVHWAGDAVHFESAVKKMHEMSPQMRLRAKTMQREINEIRNKVSGNDSKLHAAYFWLQNRTQLIVDTPTWWGAYEKAMAENEMTEDKAIALADQAVLDSQGGGQIKDQAGIQRGTSGLKLFTTFYSYFNTTLNNTAEAYGRTNFKKPKEIALFAADMVLLYSIPALLSTLLKAGLQADWDDKDKLWKKIIGDQISYMLGTIVGLREATAGAQAITGTGEGFGYSGPASVRFFSDLFRLGQQAHQGELDAPFWKSLDNVMGILFHYPAGQINRTAEGIAALVDGKTENPGAVLMGPTPKH